MKNAKELVDFRKIEIDYKRNRVRIGKGQEIITGSFIKSYAIDRVREEMYRLGIRDGIINAGGSSIIALGEAEGEPWEVAVENPASQKKLRRDMTGCPREILEEAFSGEGDNDLFDIRLLNESYSTSNQLNTYMEIGKKRYGHIISPVTGFPGENIQIGIVTGEAFIGDIISTGLYNQTPEEFQRIMKSLQKEMKIEGYLIDKEGKIHYSEGFSDYMTMQL